MEVRIQIRVKDRGEHLVFRFQGSYRIGDDDWTECQSVGVSQLGVKCWTIKDAINSIVPVELPVNIYIEEVECPTD